LLRSDIILCFYKFNNKENTRLISESRILHLHKIMYSAPEKKPAIDVEFLNDGQLTLF